MVRQMDVAYYDMKYCKESSAAVLVLYGARITFAVTVMDLPIRSHNDADIWVQCVAGGHGVDRAQPDLTAEPQQPI